MSLRQLFKPDFRVCEYRGESRTLRESGSFPVFGETLKKQEEDALNKLEKICFCEGVATIRRPTLIERLQAQ